ncbi:porin [Epibacterium sp. SM1969]|uniref:Porin n=1 Tax=Tritonibacter aquimaris TaxID=2663379 RepID=A0A844AQG4_9RHOB|nr:porin [Tritonibacter aquimaris]MQY41787.1 porin [Tritonibacter aquimaris]
MKKILFATTALIATAGVAAAESNVKLGGYGRFGLAYNDGATGTRKETRLEQRFRINISASAETDAGVKVEGRFQLESNEGSSGGAAGDGPGAAGFAVSYEGFRLDLGHVSDVIDSGDVVDFFGHGIGLTDLIESDNTLDGVIDAEGFGEEDIFRQTVKARYSVGDFTVAASFTEENDSADAVAEEEDYSYYQIGAAYDFGTFAVGAAFGERDDAAETSYWVANVSGDFGNLSYNVLVGDSDALDAGDADVGYSISAAYKVSSATEIRALVAGGGLADLDGGDEAFGLGFRHKLGGGVSLRGGVAQDSEGNDLADLGIRFDF